MTFNLPVELTPWGLIFHSTGLILKYIKFREITVYKHNQTNNWYWPRGKESTEVWITQNNGKESENSYQKFKRSQ